MLKVGLSKNPDTNRILNYPQVKYDLDGWADASVYLPKEFDLVYLRCEESNKTVRGWFCGKYWDGLRYKDQKVLYWKRCDDE